MAHSRPERSQATYNLGEGSLSSLAVEGLEGLDMYCTYLCMTIVYVSSCELIWYGIYLHLHLCLHVHVYLYLYFFRVLQSYSCTNIERDGGRSTVPV